MQVHPIMEGGVFCLPAKTPNTKYEYLRRTPNGGNTKQIQNTKSQMSQTSRNGWMVWYFGHLKFDIV
jgi:hypothetical protein